MRDGLNRRDFHKLSAAAIGGLIAGTAIGCADNGSKPAESNANSVSQAGNKTPASPNLNTVELSPASTDHATGSKPDATTPDATAPGATGKTPVVAATMVAYHACRGLNDCKQLGKDKKNNCAGQGNCYTVPSHDCGGKNDCKYQGGCGGTEGVNDCKGKGGCGHFPISGDAWKKARDAFESRMAKAGKKVGKAPEAVKS